MKKRSLSLLEVIIAMVLTTVLLTALFRFYHQVSTSNLFAHQMRQKMFSLTLMQTKLGQVFAQLVVDEEKEGSTFYTTTLTSSNQLALLFQYNNGIDPDPIYCNTVEMGLYVDEKKQLISRTRSLPGLIARQEVLLEGVEKFSFRFFDAAQQAWIEEWPEENGGLPLMIELSLILTSKEREPKPWKCLFFVPHEGEPILYETQKLTFGLG